MSQSRCRPRIRFCCIERTLCCSDFCDDDDLQLAVENSDDVTGLPDFDGDADSQSSDSDDAHLQLNYTAPALPISPSPRQNVCRSVVLLLHARVTVRLSFHLNSLDHDDATFCSRLLDAERIACGHLSSSL